MNVIDLVCGMKIDSSRTVYKTIYRGKLYYFCSYYCKKAFDENSEYYLSHDPQKIFHEQVVLCICV